MAFVGVAAAAVTFLPRVSMEPANRLVANDSSPTLFIIKNAGVIPLMDLQPAMGLCRLKFGSNPWLFGEGCDERHAGPIGAYVQPSIWNWPTFRKDEEHTLSVQDLFNTPLPVSDADISIQIIYRPWFLPWRRTAEVRWETRREPDGRLYWFER